MRKLDIDQIIQRQRTNQQLKDVAHDLANQLIIEFDINDGFQMAHFLSVSHGLDNHTAIRTWADKWLKDQYLPLYAAVLNHLQSDDTLYRRLKSEFFAHFPQTAVAG